MLIEPKSKLLLIGDSITDCGRAYPVGEAVEDGLGNGYVSQVNALLAATYPAHQIRVLNTGISGNTVLDLEARWDRDVLALQPDWLSVMIGINDVWLQFDTPFRVEWRARLEKYGTTMERLIARTRPRLKGLVMISPYYIEPNPFEPMRAMMDKYGSAMKTVAGRHDAIFVDAQAAFDAAMMHIRPTALALDQVHPGSVGHAILARAFLNAVGYEW